MLANPPGGPGMTTLDDREREAMAAVHRAHTGARARGGHGAAGQYALPVAIDPTLMNVSDGQINPIRQVATVTPVTTYEWRGVATEGVTATFAAEATEATDGSPVLSQPTIRPEKASVFIPYSIEVEGDWTTLAAELTKLVADAKDVAEAEVFVTGGGTATSEPEGFLIGGGSVVNAAGGTLAVGDVYALRAALPPQFRPAPCGSPRAR